MARIELLGWPSLRLAPRMARFETWAEVARLFFGAACVGVLLILLLTAEAKKIEEKEEALVAEPENEKVVAEAGDISPLSGFRTVWSKLRQFIRSFTEVFTSENYVSGIQKIIHLKKPGKEKSVRWLQKTSTASQSEKTLRRKCLRLLVQSSMGLALPF